MKKFKFAAILAAGAALALSPAYVAAQAGAQTFHMGIQAQAHADGALISNVDPRGTAAAMDLKVGDIVLELDGKPISPQVAQEHTQRTKVGDRVSMKVKREGAIIELTGTAVGKPAAAAQPATAASAAQVEPRAVVSAVRKIIAERYVLPERRAALDAVLAEGLSSGRYAVTDWNKLADLIDADLQRVGRDKHLNFNYDPPRAASMAAAQTPNLATASELARSARAANHGVTELKLLPGNIRYMAYDGFQWSGAESAAALEHAMRFLSAGDAVIIDLRRNGGGSPMAVQYLVSHFMEAGRPLVTFHMNGVPSPNTLSTLPELAAGRIVGKPLYVLTSSGTASAAEEFTGHVAGYRLGELVGSTTAGAGFRNALVPIPGGFVLSVSVGRAVLASTGRDWEAVGIAPTIRTEVPAALDAAQSHALRRLAAQAQGPERTRLEALAKAVAAKVERPSPALPLSTYAGAFGERAIMVENGKLHYRNPEGLLTALIPLGGNVFAFDDGSDLQVRFAANGRAVSALELLRAGSQPLGRYERTK